MNENKFDGMGKLYTKFRPDYPQELLDWLYLEVGISKNSKVADIGSGTGIFTKQLLQRGSLVYAVEPNDDMRRVAEANLGAFANFLSVHAAAEETTLEAGSLDFITVAQAFHWFDRQRFQAECRRILKSGGKVILVWNSRDEGSPLIVENDALNRTYCPNYKGFSGGMFDGKENEAFGEFFTKGYQIKIFENPLLFDEQGFIGRNLSGSYAPKETASGYLEYIEELKKLFEKYSQNGKLLMPNLTRCYVGEL